MTIVSCASCHQTADTEPLHVGVATETAVGPSWDQYRANATALESGELIAETDLYFANEEALRDHYEGLRLEEYSDKLAVFQQLSTGYEPVYSGEDALDIVYCVSTTVPNQATVVQDMAQATSDWEANANVRFRYDSSQNASCTSTNNNVDFAVVPTTSSSLAGCAANKLFWAAVSGALCASGPGTLEVQYSQLPLFPGLTGPGLLRHELGHMLGFRHEHPWAPGGGGCSETPTIASYDLTGRRLTAYDQASVMHYAACNGVPNVDSTISPLDQQGAISVYGMPVAWYVAAVL